MHKQAQVLLEEGNDEEALVKLQEALAINPAENDDARYDYAKLLIKLGELTTAEMVLAPALAQIPVQLRFEALRHWLACFQFMQSDEKAAWSLEQFDAHLAKDKRDFEYSIGQSQIFGCGWRTNPCNGRIVRNCDARQNMVRSNCEKAVCRDFGVDESSTSSKGQASEQ
jgi:tetratricopeptide (TPR) repeat protein